jgi:DNA-binding transcriptional LysR family regulator
MNDMNMICFLSCVRTKSISDTARDLDMTHQAVSKNIQKLEEEVGYRLFARNGQSFRLTKAGECFLHWLNETDRRLAWASDQLGITNQAEHPHLRIGFPTWLGLPDSVRNYGNQWENRGIEIDWQTGTEQFVLQQVAQGRADIGLLPGQTLVSQATQQNLFYHPLPYPAKLQMLFHRTHLNSDGTPDYPAILAQPLFLCDRSSGVEAQLLRLYRNLCAAHHCTQLEVEWVPNFASTVCESIFGGGFTLLSKDAVSCGKPSTLLQTEDLEDYPDASIPVICVYRMQPGAELILDYVREVCSA